MTKLIYFKLSTYVDAPVKYYSDWIYWIVHDVDPTKTVGDLLLEHKVIKLGYKADSIVEIDMDRGMGVYWKSPTGDNGRLVDPMYMQVIAKSATIKFADAIKELRLQYVGK